MQEIEKISQSAVSNAKEFIKKKKKSQINVETFVLRNFQNVHFLRKNLLNSKIFNNHN